MGGRKTILVSGEYYHIYNRGIARQPIFFNKREYERFLLTLTYYQYNSPPVKLSRLLQLPQETRDVIISDLANKKEKYVDIICFVLMPNHFHLLMKQTREKGITVFMSKLMNSYTKYFNTKHERIGDLMQGVFKSVHIESDEQLLHLSRYIHLNPFVSSVVKITDLISYPWSSFPDFLNGKSSFVNLKPVVSHFGSKNTYKEFVLNQADYAKRLEEIKHLTLE